MGCDTAQKVPKHTSVGCFGGYRNLSQPLSEGKYSTLGEIFLSSRLLDGTLSCTFKHLLEKEKG